MPCIPFRLGEVSGFICTPRGRRKRCSTPGCSNWGTQECDAGVKKPGTPAPKRGDARLHREHARIYYVHSVVARGQEDVTVIVSTYPPGQMPADRKGHATSVVDWYLKTDATCDKPVCSRCAVKVGKLEYCGAHGREFAKRSG